MKKNKREKNNLLRMARQGRRRLGYCQTKGWFLLKGTKVVHCKKEPYDVYIGRPSKWGNPFVIGKDGNREEVIEKYRAWVQGRPELMRSLSSICGRTLGCWCKPSPCHGDVLAELADDSQKLDVSVSADYLSFRS